MGCQVMSKQLQEQGYYKKKGLVKTLASPFVARISMLDSGDVLQVRCYYVAADVSGPFILACDRHFQPCIRGWYCCTQCIAG